MSRVASSRPARDRGRRARRRSAGDAVRRAQGATAAGAGFLRNRSNIGTRAVDEAAQSCNSTARHATRASRAQASRPHVASPLPRWRQSLGAAQPTNRVRIIGGRLPRPRHPLPARAGPAAHARPRARDALQLARAGLSTGATTLDLVRRQRRAVARSAVARRGAGGCRRPQRRARAGARGDGARRSAPTGLEAHAGEARAWLARGRGCLRRDLPRSAVRRGSVAMAAARRGRAPCARRVHLRRGGARARAAAAG